MVNLIYIVVSCYSREWIYLCSVILQKNTERVIYRDAPPEHSLVIINID